MINLLLIKEQKKYDFTQETQPDKVGTWLCTCDNEKFKSGYSYEITSEISDENNIEVFKYKRIESSEDNKALKSIYPTIETLCVYLNEWFIPKTYSYCQNCHSSRPKRDFINGSISPIKDIIVNDLVRVNGLRNRFVSYVIELTNTGIKVDNKNLINTTEPSEIDLMVLPASIQLTIAKMINYDCYVRNGVNLSLKSETIGNYSYTIDDNKKYINSLDYPAEIINSVEFYSKVRGF